MARDEAGTHFVERTIDVETGIAFAPRPAVSALMPGYRRQPPGGPFPERIRSAYALATGHSLDLP